MGNIFRFTVIFKENLFISFFIQHFYFLYFLFFPNADKQA